MSLIPIGVANSQSQKFYQEFFSKNGKIFKRNEIGSKPFYLSSEPQVKTCSPKCGSKDLVFDRKNGEYVCKNDACKNCGTVVLEKVFEKLKEMTQAEKDALEMYYRDIEENQTGNL